MVPGLFRKKDEACCRSLFWCCIMARNSATPSGIQMICAKLICTAVVVQDRCSSVRAVLSPWISRDLSKARGGHSINLESCDVILTVATWKGKLALTKGSTS